MLELSSNEIPYILRSGDLAGQGNLSTLCIARCVATAVTNVSRPQTVLLQAFSWLPSDQRMAITGTKAESAFIRKHNRSPLRPQMNSGLIPMVSQMAMAWSRWNVHYKTPVARSCPLSN
ncbi:uncharacterized protein TNCV_2863011 [Trichonephila clavipes]|nr:uncharacterized protein TNCV_2863011 [Trichonephila clavipes]